MKKVSARVLLDDQKLFVLDGEANENEDSIDILRQIVAAMEMTIARAEAGVREDHDIRSDNTAAS